MDIVSFSSEERMEVRSRGVVVLRRGIHGRNWKQKIA